MLEAVFELGDMEWIQMMQPKIEDEDRLVWHFRKKGRFTVKTAYRLASPLAELSSTSTAINLSSWGFLWRVRVAPKVQLFSWRCCHLALPTKANLRS
ncbi:UNVERIFIED_CONTAM: hypothetical protein Slati_0476300 [Sesamum latifolium]|uniref:Reverse transcriptase zinc-binding domain-containing protein n=1 Tax=Sesamum latifolium TaxID=2727402 RepID=A0AAW2XZW7_9LAMI